MSERRWRPKSSEMSDPLRRGGKGPLTEEHLRVLRAIAARERRLDGRERALEQRERAAARFERQAREVLAAAEEVLRQAERSARG